MLRIDKKYGEQDKLARIAASFDKTRIAFTHLRKGTRDTVFIICHGFAMSKDARIFLELSDDLYELYDVIAMDQRGHGTSGGIYSFTSKEHEDIKAVIDYAKEYYRRIYLLGFSLGAASSIIEVARYKNVDGLIAVSGPLSFEKIENRFWEKEALWPGIQHIGSHTFRLRLGNVFVKKKNPVDEIGKIAPIPLLIIHGDRDPIIFKHHADALYKNAKKPKKLAIIKNGLHAEELYKQNPRKFITLCALLTAKQKKWNRGKS
ncbi:MAG: alpha/beta fold hydrolase [Candidatus Omnitrophota bacterium]